MFYPLPSIRQKPVFIYGAGVIGLSYKRQLEKKQYENFIEGYIETNPRVPIYENLPVLKLASLSDKQLANSQFLIASEAFQNEMKVSLLNAGVTNSQIFMPVVSSFPMRLPVWPKNSILAKSVCFYPKVKSLSALADLLERTAWYLASLAPNKIIIPVDSSLNIDSCDTTHVTITYASPLQQLEKSDLILVWDAEAATSEGLAKFTSKSYCVDPHTIPAVEVRNYRALALNCSNGEALTQLTEHSKRNFAELQKRCSQHSLTTLLGNGPSISQAMSMDLSSSNNLICNSAVKNEKLLAYVNPKAIVFDDPVFYSGYKEYTRYFVLDLITACEKHDCFCITSFDSALLLLTHWPKLAEYIIAIPVVRNQSTSWSKYQKIFNTPSLEHFYVNDSWNILSLLLLPIATSISKKIELIGFDGREPKEDYYWKHNETVQYSELMQEVIDSHPAFFNNVDHQEYYVRHCQSIEAMMSHYESHGVSLLSRTFSHVPALAKRMHSEASK